MRDNHIDIVYDLVTGSRIPQVDDPEVENLFAVGRECEQLYNEVYNANLRLCKQLNVEEHADVEILVNSMLRICALVGKRMYRYGQELDHK
jgi:hypothetical protein